MSSITANIVHAKEDLNDTGLTFTTRKEVCPIPVLTHEQSQLIAVYSNEELMAFNNLKEREFRNFLKNMFGRQ